MISSIFDILFGTLLDSLSVLIVMGPIIILINVISSYNRKRKSKGNTS